MTIKTHALIHKIKYFYHKFRQEFASSLLSAFKGKVRPKENCPSSYFEAYTRASIEFSQLLAYLRALYVVVQVVSQSVNQIDSVVLGLFTYVPWV